ncbi:MAG TPA: helix-turn-helix domain-containing protein [Dehalococcoidia bacterium]|nr:helix-turn-helix domain-containing protein [Dehalococcoidia bacterium]
MPRPYSLRRRQAATEETRARVIAAARELIVAAEGFRGFTIDAVARQAGVARMTVYYQFGSRRGLLEAVFDQMAARGGMERMAELFALAEPLEALMELIAVFGRFWASDREALRRFRALGALDPELGQALRARDEWRRNGCRAVLTRLAERRGGLDGEALSEDTDILFTLIGFETFDTLAGAQRSPEAVTPLVQRLARAALGVDGKWPTVS